MAAIKLFVLLRTVARDLERSHSACCHGDKNTLPLDSLLIAFMPQKACCSEKVLKYVQKKYFV